MLNLSPSGYYAWLTRKPSKHAQEEGRLEAEIKAAHKRNRETAGPKGCIMTSKSTGTKVGICRIRKIRKKLGKGISMFIIFWVWLRLPGVYSVRGTMNIILAPSVKCRIFLEGKHKSEEEE